MAYFEEREYIDKKSGKKVTRHRAMIRLKGYPTQCGTFSNKTKAKRWAQQIESAMRDGRHFKTSEAKKHTLNELIDRYLREILPDRPKSQVKKTMQLGWWKENLGHYLLAHITPSLISECKEKLLSEITYRKTKRSNATAVRYLAALSHVFTIGMNDYGWIEDNPVKKVTKPKESRGRVRFLDNNERIQLLEACKKITNSYLYTIVVLALSTGMRQGEILNLEWKDVDLEKGRLILHETKNGDRRVVPIAGHGLQLLRQLFQDRKVLSPLVFPGKKNNEPMDIRSPWNSALSKTTIKDFRFHDLRHSAASYLAMNGASLAEIAEVLGHKTLQMVKRYAHLSEAHTANVVEKMNEKIFG